MHSQQCAEGGVEDKLELPFLRVPPSPEKNQTFAGICPCVCSPYKSASGASGAGIDAIIDAIRIGRVGGSFWKPQSASYEIIVRCDSEQILDAWMPKANSRTAFLLSGDADEALRRKAARSGIAIVLDDVDYWSLLAQTVEVHACPTDELAFTAYLLGVPVIACNGALSKPEALKMRLTENLMSYLYRDCFSGETITINDAIEQLVFWRSLFDQARPLQAVTGISIWKRKQISRMLWNGSASPRIASPGVACRQATNAKGALGVWPSRVPGKVLERAQASNTPVWRIEDGFIRSIGLGSDLTAPLSIVLDQSGIYYDPSAPSDLETLLATHAFPETLLVRARGLMTKIRQYGISKYATGIGPVGSAVLIPKDRRTILAIGQVEDDLSVQRGGNGIKGNLDFLRRVRKHEPDACILYRPHPDVLAGHRRGQLEDSAVFGYADAIDQTANVVELLERVDAVHVLSSLTGFEALIRGREVFVHGQPFYSGWGLTHDLGPPCERRGRHLSLEALVAATLILYPRYLDPVTGLLCGPEVLVSRLAQGQIPPGSLWTLLRRFQGRLRRRFPFASMIL